MKKAYIKCAMENDTLYTIIQDQDSIIIKQDTIIGSQTVINEFLKDSIVHVHTVIIPLEKEKSEEKGFNKGKKRGKLQGAFIGIPIGVLLTIAAIILI